MEQFLLENWWILVVVALWTIPWKGYALWKSARKNSVWWFIALLLINTLGILEMIYIFYISEKEKRIGE
ncbi:MAG: Membrane protein [Parcubacteria group bacterium GW2011_GWA1_44_13]|uniref:Membrane protein n=1 Tax=Candidatus Nomurabacteria bacterium GW2011_GWB1_44_12 TaxID=1618748 RepID=A0A837IID2_9BACT|nr:MAG: Membrane protein [Candidatus Nomurabacteria bacterium GW2011_GWD1_44_10]KKT36924.1 MAG: Membrane protein [Candidatus Nomurabacteria bacterium GW2011_GWB1_44_12]KKT37976.1 MAG: Membrane protein [Parcubacteria group bacterium GW2011_GWA1_44_13]KKT60841.1 MAG: Membrane protein [Parcubacteria group bacterium GW2011_GWC1_44_26]HBB44100.1 hypothetical protein [Candidatus Yonathbacteria bacterium]